MTPWGVAIPLGPPNRAVDHFSAAPTNPVRAIDTTYQNTNDTAVLVTWWFTASADTMGFAIGAQDPPTDTPVLPATALTGFYNVTAIVPPGEYYRLSRTAGSGAMTITATEWVL